jgi:hypothetical protein
MVDGEHLGRNYSGGARAHIAFAYLSKICLSGIVVQLYVMIVCELGI